MSVWYKLDENKEPVPCSVLEYKAWHDRMPDSTDWYVMKTGVGLQIACDVIRGVRVSTVFMGIDHGLGSKVPILWETMVFKDDGEECWRHETYDDACRGHLDAVGHVHDEAGAT